MDQQNNDKDEAVKAIEEFGANPNKENTEKVAIMFGFLLHKNTFIHLGLSLVINILVTMSLLGIFSLFKSKPLGYKSFIFLILALAMFTLLEYLVKYFSLRLIPRVAIYSFGSIFFVSYFLIFALLWRIMKSSFYFTDVNLYIVFVISFSIFRLVFSSVIRKAVARFILYRQGRN